MTVLCELGRFVNPQLRRLPEEFSMHLSSIEVRSSMISNGNSSTYDYSTFPTSDHAHNGRENSFPKLGGIIKVQNTDRSDPASELR